jgi:transketolase
VKITCDPIIPRFHPATLRRTILDMAYAGSTVHIGCAFSIVEVLAVLYRNYLNYPNNDPNSEARDYLVLSKGHGVMAQYACMKEVGWLCIDDIDSYFKDGTVLKGLSDSRVDGLEVTSGSLGHGFSVGVGIAMGAKLCGSEQKTFAIVGDGELNEGAIWEGAMFAAQQELNNFMVIVDDNGFQAMGKTSDIINLGSIQKKFESFGFDVVTIDGHNEILIDIAIGEFQKSTSMAPKAIIAKTVKGKGISFMENDNRWHYSRLTKADYDAACGELEGQFS